MCHLSTLDNPHPGQEQAAVFQNTAEGNYKLGQPLDHEADGILQCILSPHFSRAKARLRPTEQWVRPPQCDENASKPPAVSPLGNAALGEWLTGDFAAEVTGRGAQWEIVERYTFEALKYAMLYNFQFNSYEFALKNSIWHVYNSHGIAVRILTSGNKCLSPSKRFLHTGSGSFGSPKP